MIMFCHLDVAQSHNEREVTHLANILHTFTVGVDIFVFLSGFGLYYSYAKTKVPYLSFVKKRISRVLPQYLLIAGTTYLIYDLLIRRLSFLKFVKDLTFLSWFQAGSTRYWYILAILAFYLLFPLIFRCVSGGKILRLATVMFCLCWWFAVETASLRYPEAARFRIALARLPVFVLGTYVGKLAFKGVKINKALLVLALPFGYLALVVLKRLLPRPYYDYMYYPVRGLLGISIMATIILVLEALKNKTPGLCRAAAAVLGWFGGLTLELYLLHQSFLILFEYPDRFVLYCLTAFILPTLAAAGIFFARRKRRKGHENLQHF